MTEILQIVDGEKEATHATAVVLLLCEIQKGISDFFFSATNIYCRVE